MVAIGPTPGKHPDQRADEAAGEAERQVLETERDGKAELEIADQIAHRIPLR